MSKKMGRPTVPKAKYRGILMQARVSPEESQAINKAIKRSGESKSEWMRNALLEAAKEHKTAS
jgi:uncharacterized protein (DUF1778 family)